MSANQGGAWESVAEATKLDLESIVSSPALVSFHGNTHLQSPSESSI